MIRFDHQYLDSVDVRLFDNRGGVSVNLCEHFDTGSNACVHLQRVLLMAFDRYISRPALLGAERFCIEIRANIETSNHHNTFVVAF